MFMQNISMNKVSNMGETWAERSKRLREKAIWVAENLATVELTSSEAAELFDDLGLELAEVVSVSRGIGGDNVDRLIDISKEISDISKKIQQRG